MEIPTIFAINYQDTVPGPFSIKKDTQILINKLNDISSVINMFMKQNPSANILIHCQAGINRSATIIAYYLIKYRGYDPKDIIKKIRLANATQRNNTPALINPLFEEIIVKTLNTLPQAKS